MSSEINVFANICVLAPTPWCRDLDGFFRTIRTLAVEPFNRERLALLQDLSQRILQHPRLRHDAGAAALGFWLRRANLTKLGRDFESGARAGVHRIAAGVVLHIAPANVDTMFVLSWTLSFLAGNSNIVRLTTRPSPIMQDLLGCLTGAFASAPKASEGNLFITYEYDDAITARLSFTCDTRIIWGGDETVQRIRGIPLNPHATERAFASKRSLSVLNATVYLSNDEASRNQVATRMAADLAPFAQLACSSPRVMCWIGDETVSTAAAADFAKRLEAAMAERMEPDLGWATRRINHSFAAAGEGLAIGFVHGPHTTIVRAATFAAADLVEPCGAGMLMQIIGATLDQIGATLSPHHQTITYYGIDGEQRRYLAEIAGRAGVDRIVPIGRALEFAPMWDGYDLWGDLTRSVLVH